MLNGVAHRKTTTLKQPIIIIFVAIALVAVVLGFILISTYVLPNIHEFCQSRLGALHCYQVQYPSVFSFR